MTTCDVVAERVALGEPLGDAADHAERCPKCRRLVALPTELGATHREADPGLGFAARMTAGAQHRVVVRRRRRIAAGMAGVVAAAAMAAFFVTREPDAPKLATTPPDQTQQPATNPHEANKNDPWDASASSDVDEDVRALIQLADTDAASRTTAHWKKIEQPLD
ncbi:MAG TPA: hypothetical protein VMZ53_07840, partial [Kofleriaceae bacterium]|nr:hypothetical protein [Kofleriaceae bacterium]